MILSVYALVSSPRTVQSLNGVAGERLRAVRFDGLMAVVGDVRRRPAASARNLRRYAAVVESIAARVPAILPVRFGTTFDDVAELTSVLRSRGVSMRRRLRAVRGRTQMTVRLVSEPESRDVSRASQSRAASRARVRLEHGATQGTQYLQDQLAVLRTAREARELGPIRPAIRRFVKDERVERRRGVATVHHLIPRAMAGPYRAALQRAAADTGIRLAVSGPFPPYAFADNC